MTIQIVEKATRTVRCDCGSLLSYNLGDEVAAQPPAGQLCTFGVRLGWPHITCPACKRAVLVPGAW